MTASFRTLDLSALKRASVSPAPASGEKPRIVKDPLEEVRTGLSFFNEQSDRTKQIVIGVSDFDLSEFIGSLSACSKKHSLIVVNSGYGKFAISKASPEDLIDKDPSNMGIPFNGKKIILIKGDSVLYVFGLKDEISERSLNILKSLDDPHVALIIALAEKNAGCYLAIRNSMDPMIIIDAGNAFGYVEVQAGINHKSYKIYPKRDASGAIFKVPNASGFMTEVSFDGIDYIVFASEGQSI